MHHVNFHLDSDADGVLTVTWDMPGRSMNVVGDALMALDVRMHVVHQIAAKDDQVEQSARGQPVGLGDEPIEQPVGMMI